MKKFFVLTLAALLLAGLISCGDSTDKNSSSATAYSTESERDANPSATVSDKSMSESGNESSNDSLSPNPEENSEEDSEENPNPPLDPSTLEYIEITDYAYKDGKSGIFISVDYKKQDYIMYAYIEEWDEYFPFVENNGVATRFIPDAFGASLCGDSAWIAFVDPSSGFKNIKTVKLTRGDETFETQIFDTGFERDNIFGVFCNFYDGNSGSLFIVNDEIDRSFTFLKTNDGGKTWYTPESDVVLKSSYREWPTVAKFLSDEIGIVAYRYAGGEDMLKRTYITKDGGETWALLSGIEYPFNIQSGDYATEADELQFAEGIYLLTVQVYDGNGGFYIFYSSEDLLTWTLEE